MLGDRVKRLRSHLLLTAIKEPKLPSRAKRSIAQRQLVDAVPSSASAFAKSFCEDGVVTDSGSATGLTQALLQTDKSLIRFADGEALLLLGKPTWFQLPHQTLRSRLYDIFFGYSKDSDYILAVMDSVFRSPQDLRAEGDGGKLWRNTVKARGLEVIAHHVGARDAEVFYANTYRENREDPSPLWASAEQIVLVSNRRIYMENKEKRRFRGAVLHHVEIPEVDMLPQLGRIDGEVRRRVETTGLPSREVPIIVAAGAVGKLLIAGLMRDYRALDVGAYAGWYPPRSERMSVHPKKPRFWP